MFDVRENDYDSAGNRHFGAGSDSSSFASVGPSKTNDGALKSSDQAGVMFAHLAGGRHKLQK